MKKIVALLICAVITYINNSICMELVINQDRQEKIKKDPSNINDLLENGGEYLKKLIKSGSGFYYCPGLSMAQEALAELFTKKRPYYADEDALEKRYGFHSVKLAKIEVEKWEVAHAMFNLVKGCKALKIKETSNQLQELMRLYPSVINTHSAQLQGGTLLHYVASVLIFKPFLKVMLDGGADPNMLDQRKKTPLFYVIKEGEVDSVTLLLNAKMNIAHQDSNGNTVLHYAAFELRDKCLELLCNSGADVNSQNNFGDTPLHILLKNNASKAMIKFLVSFPNTDLSLCNKVGESYLALAAKRTDVINEIQETLNVKLLDSFEGHLFIENHNLCKIVENLIWAGAWVNARDVVHPLYWGRTALHRVLDNRCEKCLKVLIGQKVNLANKPNQENDLNYIDIALHNNFHQAIKLLVSAGSCVNARDSKRGSSLKQALLLGYCDGVKTLLDCGVIIDFELLQMPIIGEEKETINALLQEAYEEQICFVCFNHQEDLQCTLSRVPCQNKHTSYFICKNCYNALKIVDGKKECPYRCKEGLDKFYDWRM